jgi:hypothetical protein
MASAFEVCCNRALGVIEGCDDAAPSRRAIIAGVYSALKH